MVDVRCYKMTEGVFEGATVIDLWVQVFIKDNYEEEFNAESDFYFQNMETEIEDIPVFSTNEEYDEEYLKEIELGERLENIIKKYAPQLMLITEHDQFKQIIEDSTQEQISSVGVVFVKKRKMVYYAIINVNDKKVLLLSMS